MVETSEVAFYEDLFTRNPTWSTRWPNCEEVPRASVILSFITHFAEKHRDRSDLKILDMGCGRGWLTHMVQVYGDCIGIDPIAPVVDHARKLFPHASFRVGSARDLLLEFASAFDVVILSEVIEHVPDAHRDAFVGDLVRLLSPGGALVVTTDRGELYKAWSRTQTVEQPVEEWLTEPQLRALFESRGFEAIAQERIYWDYRSLSLLHRATASPKLQAVLSATRQRWLLHGMRYLAGFGQAWMFRLRA